MSITFSWALDFGIVTIYIHSDYLCGAVIIVLADVSAMATAGLYYRRKAVFTGFLSVRDRVLPTRCFTPRPFFEDLLRHAHVQKESRLIQYLWHEASVFQ